MINDKYGQSTNLGVWGCQLFEPPFVLPMITYIVAMGRVLHPQNFLFFPACRQAGWLQKVKALMSQRINFDTFIILNFYQHPIPHSSTQNNDLIILMW